MHGIALHCVATGKDRLMSEQGNGLDPVSPNPVSQSAFTCTVRAVPGVPFVYRRVPNGHGTAAHGTVWA